MQSRQLVSKPGSFEEIRLMVFSVFGFLLATIFVTQDSLVAQQSLTHWYPQSTANQVPPPLQPTVQRSIPATASVLASPVAQSQISYPQITQSQIAPPKNTWPQIARPNMAQPPILQPRVSQPQIAPPNVIPGTIVPGIAPVAAAELEPAQRTIEPSQIADEINSIRKQLGGGLSRQFAETAKNHPAWKDLIENGFRNEINRLAGRSADAGQVAGRVLRNDHVHRAPELPVLPNRSRSTARSEDLRISPAVPLEQSDFEHLGQTENGRLESVASSNRVARGFAPMVSTPNPAEQLRIAARTLDQMAGQFEATGLYAEADQVRAQAQRFWMQSRQFQTSSK